MHKRLPQGTHLLVAVDFSSCSRRALRTARDLNSDAQARMIVLHVIDQRFAQECTRRRIGDPEQIKKQLFMDAKTRLTDE